MLALFRISDPLRLVFVLLLLLCIRMPLLWQDFPLFSDELRFMLLGERLNQDARLYLDIWESVSPLFAVLCEVIDSLVGRNVFFYRLFALFLVYFQAIWFNGLFVVRDVVTERNYVPAFLYVLFMSAVPDFWILSPELLSLTFLLITLRSVISINEYTSDANIFGMGASMGFAVAIFLPSFVFALWLLIGLIVFRTTEFRQYLLIFYSAFLVLLSVAAWMYAEQLFFAFLKQYVFIHLPLTAIWRIPVVELLILAILPTLLLTIAFFRVRLYPNYINFQLACQQVMFIWGLNAFVVFVFCAEISPTLLMFFVPSLVFYSNGMLLLIERKWWAELCTLLIALVCISYVYNSVHAYYTIPFVYNGKSLCVVRPSNFSHTQKRVLVLGSDLSYYQDNYHCMPYLNWQLSKNHWLHLNEYETMEEVFLLFESEKPQVVVDLEGRFSLVQRKLPELARVYALESGSKNVYYRK
ncbi:MAG: hypothetical protein EAZ57_00570 [Cytophagales bacterium]|nr:MAG: hypothetical protein EAZ57_00570 [Cytophagales bacterium]